MAHLSDPDPALIARVRRLGGQVAAVEKALVAGSPCGEVLQRLAAVRGAVNSLLAEVLADHLDAHVAQPGLSDAERAAGADELLAVIRRYAR